MNRKDKTVKQLQAECRKRKIGFMMNWTKAALIKRLEDEDIREKSILSLQKELDKSKKAIHTKEKATKKLKTTRTQLFRCAPILPSVTETQIFRMKL